jgi:hypothetical protein
VSWNLKVGRSSTNRARFCLSLVRYENWPLTTDNWP